MLGTLLLLSLVATPEAIALTGGVMLAIAVSVTMNSPVPGEIYVRAPEKQAEIDLNSNKGVQFRADGKIATDSGNPLSSSTQSSTLSQSTK
jgi:hypothetical protein